MACVVCVQWYVGAVFGVATTKELVIRFPSGARWEEKGGGGL